MIISDGKPIREKNYIKLTTHLFWQYRGNTYEVPNGFQSDGASIPKPLRFLWKNQLADVTSPLNIASYLHDFPFQTRRQILKNGKLTKISNQQNNILFYKCLRDQGVTKEEARVLYSAVALFSWIWF